MLDKDGKLFGKINIIDFIVIIAVIIAGCMFAYGKISGDSALNQKDEELVFTFYAEEVKKTVAENISVGSVIHDKTCDIYLGECTGIEIGDSVSYLNNENNEFVKSSREGYVSVKLSCRVSARYTDIGAYKEGMNYGVGHTLSLYAGDGMFSARVFDIERTVAE